MQIRRNLPVFYLMTLVFFGLSRGGSAESLAEMTAAAKKYDARFLAAKADYNAKKCQADLAAAKLLPSIDVGAGLAKNYLQVTYDNRRFTKLDRNFDTSDWSARITQPIFRPETWSDLFHARKTGEYSLCSLRAAESDLILRLVQAYYDVLSARENIRFLEGEKITLTAQWLSSQGLHKSGAIAGTEPLQVQARLSLVTASLLEAQWGLANKKRILESIAGPDLLDPAPANEADIDTDPGDIEDWLGRVSENDQVRAARISVEMSQADEWKARSGFWPSIDVVGSYGDAQEGPTAVLPVETYSKSYSAGIRCTWPLFAGGRTLAECREAQNNREKALAELAAAERETGIQIAEAYSGICSGMEQVKALDQGIRANEEVVQSMQKGYEAGARTLAQVLESRRNLLDAKRSRSQAFYKLLINQRKLHLAISECDF